MGVDWIKGWASCIALHYLVITDFVSCRGTSLLYISTAACRWDLARHALILMHVQPDAIFLQRLSFPL
jgi:hypothetical protein